MADVHIDTQLRASDAVIQQLNELIQLELDAGGDEHRMARLKRIVEELGGTCPTTPREAPASLKLLVHIYERAVVAELPPVALEVIVRNLEDVRRHMELT